jgi:acyl-CoA thioesterase YciA
VSKFSLTEAVTGKHKVFGGLITAAIVGGAFLSMIAAERTGIIGLISIFASSVGLMVALPRSPASCLTNAVGGHSIAFGLSVLVKEVVPAPEFAVPLAAAVSIGMMLYLDAVHPPALGTPLLIVLGHQSYIEFGLALLGGFAGLAALRLAMRAQILSRTRFPTDQREPPMNLADGHPHPGLPRERSPVIRTVAMPSDTNPAGDVFGGWLMWQMDFAAGSLAARRAKGRCATVAVQAMTFIHPVFVGDEISIFEKEIEVGRTSMKISIEAWRRSREDVEIEKVTEATFTFVAIDANRQPRPIPAE